MRKALMRAALLGAASAAGVWVSGLVIPEPADPFAPSGEQGRKIARAGLAGAFFGLVSGYF